MAVNGPARREQPVSSTRRECFGRFWSCALFLREIGGLLTRIGGQHLEEFTIAGRGLDVDGNLNAVRFHGGHVKWQRGHINASRLNQWLYGA